MTKKIIISLIAITFFLLGGVNFVFACGYGSNPCDSSIPVGVHETTSTISGSNLLLNGSVLGHYVCGSNFYYGYGIYDSSGTLLAYNTSGCTSSNPYSIALPSATGDFYVQLWDSNCSTAGCPDVDGYYLTYNHTDSVYTITGLSTNGSCGASHNVYLDLEPTSDLCFTGSATEVIYTSYEGWSWSCKGSGGGSTDYCFAYASDVFLSSFSVQCGSWANEIHVDSSPPVGSQACLRGTITDMTQGENDNWLWHCVSDTDTVSCGTFAETTISIPPTLPSDNGISCSISPTDLSTFGDCIGSIFRWLFLPSQTVLNDLYAIPQTLKTKMPFGYIFDISDLFKSFIFHPKTNLSYDFSYGSNSFEIFNLNNFKSIPGVQGAIDFYLNIIRAILWLEFGIWAFNRGRYLFSPHQLSLPL